MSFSERVRGFYGSLAGLPASRDLRGCAGGGILPHHQPRVSPGATVNSSLSSFVIRGLEPSTLYKVHIMASTVAGSTNGTSLTLVTRVLGEGCREGEMGGDPQPPVLPQPHGTAQLAVPTAVPVTLSHFPDDTEIQFLFLTLGLVFVALVVLLICFQKNER